MACRVAGSTRAVPRYRVRRRYSSMSSIRSRKPQHIDHRRTLLDRRHGRSRTPESEPTGQRGAVQRAPVAPAARTSNVLRCMSNLQAGGGGTDSRPRWFNRHHPDAATHCSEPGPPHHAAHTTQTKIERSVRLPPNRLLWRIEAPSAWHRKTRNPIRRVAGNRASLEWARRDSNPRRRCQQIYSLPPLATWVHALSLSPVGQTPPRGS